MNHLINVSAIVNLHRESIVRWKADGVNLTMHDFLRAVEENHAFNFQLWAVEDEARRDDLGPEFVRTAKRQIDHYNQQRNNRMEWIDSIIWDTLQPASASDCAVHSETPGMMIDRLSILALKSYHMGLQAKRTDVDTTHIETSRAKTMMIDAQLKQLTGCLTALLNEVVDKTRTFCLYRQFKMYNDPSMNLNMRYQNALFGSASEATTEEDSTPLS
jgi:hypothetical protein